MYVTDVHVHPCYLATRQVHDGIPGDCLLFVAMDGVKVEGLKGAGVDEVEGGAGEDNGEEGYEDGDDHEIEAAAGSLVAGVSKAVVGEGRLGGFGNLAEAYVYEDYGGILVDIFEACCAVGCWFVILTCIAGSDKRHKCRWEDLKDNIGPRGGIRPGTPNQGANVISLPCKRIRPGYLHQRQREDDEGLDDVAPSLFPARRRVGPQAADLDGQVPHDGQQACGIDADAKVVQIGVEVAQAVARPPGCHIVVAPDESIDNISQVLHLGIEDEDGGGEFSVAVEQPQGDEADEVGEDAKEDAADEVGRE